MHRFLRLFLFIHTIFLDGHLFWRIYMRFFRTYVLYVSYFMFVSCFYMEFDLFDISANPPGGT